jgi:hypothetical protein
MTANSAAKIAQMIQFAVWAKVFQPAEVASRSMMSTGIIASIATMTIGSNG